MSIGASIYFTPVDRSWISTPEFIQGVAYLFGVNHFESLSVWHTINAPADADLAWGECEKELLKVRNPSVEVALSAHCTEADCTTIMYLPGTETLTMPMGEAILATLPEELSEGWIPLDALVRSGQWEVYDQGGDRVDGGNCCIELGSSLGYPVEIEQYLEAFLKVSIVMDFQKRLETLSSQPWTAIMELT